MYKSPLTSVVTIPITLVVTTHEPPSSTLNMANGPGLKSGSLCTYCLDRPYSLPQHAHLNSKAPSLARPPARLPLQPSPELLRHVQRHCASF